MRYAEAEAVNFLNKIFIFNWSKIVYLVQKIIFCKFHRIRLDRLFYIIILSFPGRYTQLWAHINGNTWWEVNWPRPRRYNALNSVILCKVNYSLNHFYMKILCGGAMRHDTFWEKFLFPTGSFRSNWQPQIIFCKFHRRHFEPATKNSFTKIIGCAQIGKPGFDADNSNR